MQVNIIDNIIKKVIDLPSLTHNWMGEGKESISWSIMRIIFEELSPIVSNAVILRNNQVNKTKTPIINVEFYPQSFNPDAFLKKENIVRLEKCIYPTKGSELFKNNSDLFKSKIEYWSSVWVLPIHNIHNDNTAVLVFFASGNSIPFSNEQIDFLKKIIDDAYNFKTSFLQYSTYKFIEDLSDFTRIPREEKTLSDKFDNLSEALKKHKDNVVHFTVWKVDDIGKKKFKVIKEKNQHIRGIPVEDSQKYLLKDTDERKIIEYIKRIKDNGILNDGIELSKFIESGLFVVESPESGFADIDYRTKIGIDDETTIVYIPIIPIRDNEKRDTMSILCLYVNKLQHTIFRNPAILSIISQKIYETLTLYSQLIRNDTTTEILGIQESDEKKYYYKVAKKLKDRNECSDCYIYIKQEKTDDSLKRVIGIEKEKEIAEWDYLQENYSITTDCNMAVTFPLSKKLLNDNRFCDFLKKTQIKQVVDSEEEGRRDYLLYYGNYPLRPNENIHSAILIPIREKKQFVGFVLFTNKIVAKTNAKKTKYSPYFSAHNKLITAPSIEAIYKHKLLRDATKKSESVLGRIKHEIHREVNLITQNVDILKVHLVKEIRKVSDEENRRDYAHLINVVDYTGLSGRRMELFAHLATLIGFIEQRILTQKILEKKKSLDVKNHINSMKDVFRAEAKEYGVGIAFEENHSLFLSNVSRFYQFAINNIIFNAIRYSRFGTCVVVRINEDNIEVINHGMEIKKDEIEERIYKEGYRGEEAKNFTRDGMGLGLFLTKEVITAHTNHSLSCTSNHLCRYNYSGIKAFYDFVDKQPSKYGLELYNNQKENDDVCRDGTLYNRNRVQLELEIPNSYYHRSIDCNCISNLINIEFKEKNVLFEVFEERYLKKEVYETIFTIKFK